MFLPSVGDGIPDVIVPAADVITFLLSEDIFSARTDELSA